MQLQPNSWHGLSHEGGWRTCKMANAAAEGRGEKNRAAGCLSHKQLWLPQIACIFRIHAHGVFIANLSPKVRLERGISCWINWSWNLTWRLKQLCSKSVCVLPSNFLGFLSGTLPLFPLAPLRAAKLLHEHSLSPPQPPWLLAN